jgi:iron complex outermembrane receptor protein
MVPKWMEPGGDIHMRGIFGLTVQQQLMTSAAAIVMMASATPAMAQTRTFNVPAGPASRSIPIFAKQAGVQILASGDIVKAKRTKAVRGNLTVEEGLRRLLDDTGLATNGNANGIITIGVAAAGNGQAVSSTTDDESLDEDERGKSEILVVGSRSQNVDIRRTEDDPQPYVVLNQQDIQKSGAISVEDLLRKRLPMNTQSTSNGQQANEASGLVGKGNISSINLRGLGATQTLILIDGRRPARVLNNGSDFTQADINGVPLSAIERIEILPSTAGGIYGGGAVGGVINIIRKRNYNGVDLRMSYDGTFRGGGEIFRAEMSGGFTPDNGATQVTFSGSYSTSRPLLAGDNNLSMIGRQLYVQNDPYEFPFPALTPNILAYENLVLDNGTPLGSNKTFVPVGYAGVGSDGGAALVRNAGTYNLDFSDDTSGKRAYLASNPKTVSANVNIRRRITSWLDAFVDGTFASNSGHLLSYYQFLSFIPGDAPSNPFQQDITVSYTSPGLSRSYDVSSQAWDARGGVVARLGKRWSASAEYGWSRSRTRTIYTASPLDPAFDAGVSDGTINVIRDLNQFPIDYSGFELPHPGNRAGPFETTQEIVSARFGGPLIELGGGPLGLNVLVENRRERAGENRTTSPTFVFLFPERSQQVRSAYVELRAPLVSERNARPFLQALEVQVSARYDDYKTVAPLPSSATLPVSNPVAPAFDYRTAKTKNNSYTVAGLWAPAKDLTLRASYSTGFLPPSISQIVSDQRQETTPNLPDPKRGNERIGARVPYLNIFGGNPDLSPEQSESLSFGAILTPQLLSGLRVSLDYTKIRKDGEIAAVSALSLIASEESYPGRVERGPNLPGDLPGWAGPVTKFDARLINFLKSKIEAFDAQIDYSFDTKHLGSVRLYGVGTLQKSLERQIATARDPFEFVGYSNGPLRWRLNGGIDWNFLYL